MNFSVLGIKSDRAAIGLFGLCTLPHGGKGCTQNIMEHSNIWMLLRSRCSKLCRFVQFSGLKKSDQLLNGC